MTAALAVGLAVLLWPASRPRPRLLPGSGTSATAWRGAAAGVVPTTHPVAWPPGRRAAVSLLAGCGAWVLLPGPAGPVAGLGVGLGAWVSLGRVEPAGVRRDRERLRRELPHVVSLLASALRGGAAPQEALLLVAHALPGPAADRFRHLAARLALGTDPAVAWTELGAADPVLAGLGRSMSRAHRSGAPVALAVERLAVDLARTARAEVEDRARAVGVKAAVPLGLCLLPAFILIGIVPLVAGLMATVV